MNQDKIISIKCGGEVNVKLEELNVFQGNLKSITSEQFNKLKQSLIKDGLPIAFHIWIDSKYKKWILDGTHRFKAFMALQDEGYFIPPIPCNVVIAKTKKEAAKTVLISNSKYAEMSQESLSDFMIDMELDFNELEFLDIPELDIGDFEINNSDEKDEKNVDINFKYKIEIDCDSEQTQKEIFEEMENRGFKVRLLI